MLFYVMALRKYLRPISSSSSEQPPTDADMEEDTHSDHQEDTDPSLHSSNPSECEGINHSCVTYISALSLVYLACMPDLGLPPRKSLRLEAEPDSQVSTTCSSSCKSESCDIECF